MNEQNPHSWHQKTWVRVLVLLLLPVIIGSLYLLTNLFAFQRLQRIPSSPSPELANPEATSNP